MNWNNDERIELRDRVLRWVKTQGVVMCEEAEVLKRLETLFEAVYAVFSDVIKETGLCAVFAYRMADQPEQHREYDSVCWRDMTSDVGALFAIGISVEVLECDAEYEVLCFLHELAHVLAPDLKVEHGAVYHAILDGLIERFNDETGFCVQNDYEGMDVAG